ncbi:hypothetical protein SDC9_127885 [bioreactor metagenome]|uniref:Uncharacterized protein n=1 Tax=bioreactor metagenome TaxID=1076179 RepID=A0A645CVA6_9ZZZZ
MEGSEGQLSSRFTDGLCSDYSYCLSHVDWFSGGQVSTVTFCTDPFLGLTSQWRTNFNHLDSCVFNLFCKRLINDGVCFQNDFISFWVEDIVKRNPTQNSFGDFLNDFVIFLQWRNFGSSQSTTIIFSDDDVLSHVNQSSGQVTCIRRFQSGICKTFTGTVSGDKVFQNGKTFLKVRHDRVFNNFRTGRTCFLRFCHQTSHPG